MYVQRCRYLIVPNGHKQLCQKHSHSCVKCKVSSVSCVKSYTGQQNCRLVKQIPLEDLHSSLDSICSQVSVYKSAECHLERAVGREIKKGNGKQEKHSLKISLRRGLTGLSNSVANKALTSLGIRLWLKNHRPMKAGRDPQKSPV